MAETIAKTREQLQKETEKLAKKTAAARGYPKGSAKRHYAKAQAQKIRGRIAQLSDLLAKLIRRRAKIGPKAAVRYGLRQVGTSESPPFSNRGPKIDAWTRAIGYDPPIFWCGAFAAACLRAGKARIQDWHRCGYGPYVAADARAHRNGYHEVPFDRARPGDHLVLFNGEHQAVCRSAPRGDSIGTVEGNTSPSSAGSQFNGGCVAAKTRSRSDVSCVARPDYPKA